MTEYTKEDAMLIASKYSQIQVFLKKEHELYDNCIKSGWEKEVISEVRKHTFISGNNKKPEYIYIVKEIGGRKGVVKIGHTKTTPKLRLKSLDGPGNIYKLGLSFSVGVSNGSHKIEKAVHRKLSHLRLRPDREWFKISVSKAKDVILQTIDEHT